MFAMTAITGIGRRLANLLCKKADIDLNKRYVANLRFGGLVAGFSGTHLGLLLVCRVDFVFVMQCRFVDGG
jgi:hypothetical protein